MPTIAHHPYERVSFSRQFLLVSGVILVAGIIVIGSWMGRQIEKNAINRAALIASVYVESIISAQLHDWLKTGFMSGQTHAVLDRIFVDGPLSRKVVRFKLWDGSGRIIYSSDHEQVGQTYPLTEHLANAFSGRMQADITDLEGADNQSEKKRWSRLLEVYVPVHGGPDRQVMAVAEFYHSMENLNREILDAQQKSWLLIALCAGVIAAVLYSLVRRANDTIIDQQRDLRDQLGRLRASLAENATMSERLRNAGAHTTAMNEQALHRIAADLHDGPAQDMAFALLRFDDLTAACEGCTRSSAPRELDSIHGALRRSLDELRAIAGGLGLPGIEGLSLSATLQRAVRDEERKSTTLIPSSIDERLGDAPISVKITAYRLIQEALNNARRHAPGHPPEVGAWREGRDLVIDIRDHGPGFDPLAASESGRLGLAFMRERVLLVGGVFEIDSAPESGTRIRARIPLNEELSYA